MNDVSHSERVFDPRIFDRLVDGELSEAERRELLQMLDRRPDGWRRCALAFLEQQTWGQALAEQVRQADTARRIRAGKPREGSRRGRRSGRRAGLEPRR